MAEILHQKVRNLADGEVVTFLVELCKGAEFPMDYDPSYTVEDLLSLVLQCHAPHLVLGSFYDPDSLVTRRVDKLPDPLRKLAVEIGVLHRVNLGDYDRRAFLTFLKASYPSQKKLFASISQGRRRIRRR